MPLTLEGTAPHLVLEDTWQSQQKEKREQDQAEAGKPKPELTEDELEKLKIIVHVNRLYDEARTAREPYETFDIAWELFTGCTFPKMYPTWRAKITINKIRAFITFMQAIMTDNKPRITVEPLVDGTEDASDLLRKLVDRDWDMNDMQNKLATFVLYGLIWGTGFMKVWADPNADGGRGRQLVEAIPPYNIYTNRTATRIENAEYLIHVEQQSMGWICRNFPDRADAVQKVCGRPKGSDEDRDRDYIREGYGSERTHIISAQSINGNIVGPQYVESDPRAHEQDGDEVELMEAWLRDDTMEPYQRQKVVNDVPQTTDALDEHGLPLREIAGYQLAPSPIDGVPYFQAVYKTKRVPIMEWDKRLKFPGGRLVLIAGGKVLLRDIPNPFQIDGFPFAMWKDYDVGSFWGQGEPLALKDTQIALNRVISQIYDILERIGNPSFKLKKGAGVDPRSIKNKPGYIIPMDELNALEPLDKPPIPREFIELFGMLRNAMGDISGVNDSVMGQLPAANTAFATMDQLQESGAAPIRLKVRNFESGIVRIGKLRVQLIQQFDRGDRPIRTRIEKQPASKTDEDGDVVQPASNVELQFKKYTNADLQGAVEFSVVPISSLSTSPAGAWNRWMDLYKSSLVDRKWWHQKFRLEGWKTELPRMEREMAAAAAAKAASKKKPGPAPKAPTRQARKTQAPVSHVPTRAQNAAIR